MLKFLSPTLLIVMGVSGSGKSTLGRLIADNLTAGFIEGDELHSQDNVQKMAAGLPLDDADREPWLRAIRKRAIDNLQSQLSTTSDGAKVVVVACSALRRSYRDILRGKAMDDGLKGEASLSTCFVYLKGPEKLIKERIKHRQAHFMGAKMLTSQLDTLEEPHPLEEDRHNKIISLPLTTSTGQTKPPHQLLDEALKALGRNLPVDAFSLCTSLPPISCLLEENGDSVQLKKSLALLLEVPDAIQQQLLERLKNPNATPLRSYAELVERCQYIVEEEFSLKDQVNFLRGHPRIGQVKKLSRLSSKEQGDQTDPTVLARLEELNNHYEKLYPGLRYVTFVNGRSRKDIIGEMEAMMCEDGLLPHSPFVHCEDDAWKSELRRGIADVFKIAHSRLKPVILT